MKKTKNKNKNGSRTSIFNDNGRKTNMPGEFFFNFF